MMVQGIGTAPSWVDETKVVAAYVTGKGADIYLTLYSAAEGNVISTTYRVTVSTVNAVTAALEALVNP